MANLDDKIAPGRKWTWDEWQRTRYARRMSGKTVTSAVIRRSESNADERLRAANDGERGPRFPTDEELLKIAKDLGGPVNADRSGKMQNIDAKRNPGDAVREHNPLLSESPEDPDFEGHPDGSENTDAILYGSVSE